METSSPKLAIIVHGLFTSHTDSSPLEKLTPLLEDLGFEVYHYRYGFTDIVKALENAKVAEGLASLIHSNLPRYSKILVIGHSNGCSISHIALEMVGFTKVVDAVFLSPSVRAAARIPNSVASLEVFYNPFDVILRLMKPLSLLRNFLSRRNWGLMGVVGYSGTDRRVTNHKITPLTLFPYSHHNPTLTTDLHFTYLSLILQRKYSFK